MKSAARFSESPLPQQGPFNLQSIFNKVLFRIEIWAEAGSKIGKRCLPKRIFAEKVLDQQSVGGRPARFSLNQFWIAGVKVVLKACKIHLDTFNNMPLNISIHNESPNLFIALEIWIVPQDDLFGLFESQRELDREFQIIMTLEILLRSLRSVA